MGREGHETTVVCSSIALLQERFRQLERVKEMREERKILRMVSEPNNNNKQLNNQYNNPRTGFVNFYYQPSRSFFHPDLIFPQRSTSSLTLSLSLWPTLHGGSDDDQTPVCTKLWPCLDTSISAFEANYSSNKSQDSDDFIYETDVDTSLHL